MSYKRPSRPRRLEYDAATDRYLLHPNSLANLRAVTGSSQRNAQAFAALCEAISNLARAGVTSAADIGLVTGASIAAIYRAKRRLSSGIETCVTPSAVIACDPLLA